MSAKSGGDPDSNARLRSAVEKARAGNVPKRHQSSAPFKKATGELEAEAYEELLYEVYGRAARRRRRDSDDNRNRTAGEIRKVLEKGNAKLAASGSVLYLFHKHGHIVFDRRWARTRSWRRRWRPAPTTLRADGDVFPGRDRAGKMHDVLATAGEETFKPVHSEVGMYPETSVHLEGKDAEADVEAGPDVGGPRRRAERLRQLRHRRLAHGTASASA